MGNEECSPWLCEVQAVLAALAAADDDVRPELLVVLVPLAAGLGLV